MVSISSLTGSRATAPVVLRSRIVPSESVSNFWTVQPSDPGPLGFLGVFNHRSGLGNRWRSPADRRGLTSPSSVRAAAETTGGPDFFASLTAWERGEASKEFQGRRRRQDRHESVIQFLPPPRTGREEGSWRVGETRRPEGPVPRPRGCAASWSPDGGCGVSWVAEPG